MCQEWNTSGLPVSCVAPNHLKRQQISQSFEYSKDIDKVNILCYLSL
jgi:hypothetical protein